MPAAPRVLTGNLTDINAAAASGVVITFERGGVASQYGDVVLPNPTSVVTNASGAFSVTLYPGTYSAFARTASGPARFNFSLAEDGSTDLADLLEVQEVPLTSQFLLEVEAARDEAIAAVATVPLSQEDFSTVAALIADTTLTYTSGQPKTVTVGQIVPAGGFRYEVAAVEAVDYHIITAGGVKLYVLPNSSREIPLSVFCRRTSATADYTGFNQAVAVASALGCGLLVDGGPGVSYTLTSASGATAAALTTNGLKIRSDGAILNPTGAGITGIIGFQAPTRASGLTLASDVSAWAQSITFGSGVVAANSIAVGDIVWLQALGVYPTTTRTSAPYHKQASRRIQRISGDTVFFDGPPIAFFFTTAETTITVYAQCRFESEGLRFQLGSGANSGRVDFIGLTGKMSDTVVRGLSDWSTGSGTYSVDGPQIYVCNDFRIDGLRLYDLRYGVGIGNAGCDIRITDVYAERNRHPIDPQGWPVNVVVDGFAFNDNYNSIEAHAGFGTTYRNGIAWDVLPDFGPRGSGSICENVTLRGIGGAIGTTSTTIMSYTSSYDYIYGATGPYGEVGLFNCFMPETNIIVFEAAVVRIGPGCSFNLLSIDGTSQDVARVIVAPDMRTNNDSNLRRVRIDQPGLAIDARGGEATWSSTSAITSISNANPAVVTLTSHGICNLQRVTIAGVTGLTEANGTWTATWISANTFSIPLDSTALGSASGGTLARTGLTLRADDTAGIGSAKGKFRRRIRETAFSDFSRQSSYVQPIRIYPEPSNANAKNIRFGTITVIAASRHDGMIQVAFGFQIDASGNWVINTTGVTVASAAGSVGSTLTAAIGSVSGAYSTSADANYVQFDLTISGISSGGSSGQPLPVVDIEVDTFGPAS